MKITDFHIHFYSHAYFRALADKNRLGLSETDFFTKLESDGIHIPEPDPATQVSALMSQAAEHLVEQLVLIASAPEEIDTLGSLCKSNPRIHGFAVFNPKSQNAISELNRLKSMGIVGLALYPVLHRYHAHDAAIQSIWDYIEELGFLVMIHYGILKFRLRDAAGLKRTYGGQFTDPITLIEVADRHPETIFIIPHFGNGFFREVLLLGANSPNVYLDTSSSNSWTEYYPTDISLSQVFRKARHVFGPGRLLFGTASGILPRGFRHDILEKQTKAMAEAAFEPNEIAMVMGENASRILKK